MTGVQTCALPIYLQTAIALVEALETDMAKTFVHIRTGENAARTTDLLRIMRVYGKMSRTQLFRVAFTQLSMQRKEFDEIISSACDAGLLRQGAGLTLTLVSDNSLKSADTEEHTDEPEEAPFPEAAGS